MPKRWHSRTFWQTKLSAHHRGRIWPKTLQRKVTLYDKNIIQQKTLIGRLHQYFLIYFENFSAPTADTLFLFILSILTLESAHSIQFLYQHFFWNNRKIFQLSLNFKTASCRYIFQIHTGKTSWNYINGINDFIHTSWLLMHRGNASTSPNALSNTHLLSITSVPASGSISPSPNNTLPSVTTRQRLWHRISS